MKGDPDFRPTISVLAGTNGAGKSSIAGAAFRKDGADYFNPDEVTRGVMKDNPDISLEEANEFAWLEGKRLLERAIEEKLDWAFETTLGGNSISDLLQRAAESGSDVCIWYAGLSSPELHIARVRARVAKGGHDIPERRIRERYASSRSNLIRLLPYLTSLQLYDNSEEGDPATKGPRPKLLLSVDERTIEAVLPLDEVPQWAKQIVIAALESFQPA